MNHVGFLMQGRNWILCGVEVKKNNKKKTPERHKCQIHLFMQIISKQK